MSERRTTSFDARWIEKSEVDASGEQREEGVRLGVNVPADGGADAGADERHELGVRLAAAHAVGEVPRRANDAMMRARDAVCATLAVVLIALAADAITKKCCG